MIGIKVKLRRSGNSSVLSVTKDVQDLLGWKLGDLLNIKVVDDQLVVQKVKESVT